MIYFLKENTLRGRIKIGYSSKVKERMGSLQTANSNELQLLAVVDGGLRTEKNLHFHFDHLRIRGEWFEPGRELLEFIDEIKMAGLNVQPFPRLKIVV